VALKVEHLQLLIQADSFFDQVSPYFEPFAAPRLVLAIHLHAVALVDPVFPKVWRPFWEEDYRRGAAIRLGSLDEHIPLLAVDTRPRHHTHAWRRKKSRGVDDMTTAISWM
jgi:hypothetical protein